MNDIIYRQDAIDVAMNDNLIVNAMDSVRDGDIHRTKRAITRLLKSMPSAERKKGKWLDDCGLYRCSNCNHIFSELWWVANCPIDRMNKIMRFCPQCGAKMGDDKE